MELITVTEKSDPELFRWLREDPEFDASHISKHGRGYVECKATSEDGRKFMCDTEWDSSWGIEWDYVTWQQVEEFTKTCPCCGQVING